MLTYFLIGALVGALTGVPIGPVNVAVIDAAYRHTMRRAIAVGVGGALADGLYASAGILGVGPWLQGHPSVPPVLFAFSSVVLIVYGFLTTRTQPVTPAAAADPPPAPAPSKEIWSGFTVGIALIVLNPAAIVTWVVIIGPHLVGADRLEGLGAVLGIFTGSASWFVLVAWLTHQGKHVMGDKAVWIPRVVGILLVGYGLYLMGRAVSYLF